MSLFIFSSNKTVQYIVTVTLIVLSLFAQCKIFNLNNTYTLMNHVLIGTTWFFLCNKTTVLLT
jgi:hypothetical protein